MLWRRFIWSRILVGDQKQNVEWIRQRISRVQKFTTFLFCFFFSFDGGGVGSGTRVRAASPGKQAVGRNGSGAPSWGRGRGWARCWCSPNTRWTSSLQGTWSWAERPASRTGPAWRGCCPSLQANTTLLLPSCIVWNCPHQDMKPAFVCTLIHVHGRLLLLDFMCKKQMYSCSSTNVCNVYYI